MIWVTTQFYRLRRNVNVLLNFHSGFHQWEKVVITYGAKPNLREPLIRATSAYIRQRCRKITLWQFDGIIVSFSFNAIYRFWIVETVISFSGIKSPYIFSKKFSLFHNVIVYIEYRTSRTKKVITIHFHAILKTTWVNEE